MTGLARDRRQLAGRNQRRPVRGAQIVNAAGAWADRIAAMLGEPVPLDVVAPMLMITAGVPPFIKPVVILRGRKLSFKQFGNGTVLIGGGHLGDALSRPQRDGARLGQARDQRPHRLGPVPGDARGHHRARLGRHRGAHARRHSR